MWLEVLGAGDVVDEGGDGLFLLHATTIDKAVMARRDVVEAIRRIELDSSHTPICNQGSRVIVSLQGFARSLDPRGDGGVSSPGAFH